VPIVRKDLHELILADAHELFTTRWDALPDQPGSFQSRLQPISSFDEVWPEWKDRHAPQAARLRLEYEHWDPRPYRCYFLPRLDFLMSEYVSFAARPLEDYVALLEERKRARREARAIAGGMRRGRVTTHRPKRVAL
jgi:hypothetical protein